MLLEFSIQVCSVTVSLHQLLCLLDSAGCGRTGTIIVVDHIWRRIKEKKIRKDIDLLKILSKLREDRQALVQTPVSFL